MSDKCFIIQHDATRRALLNLFTMSKCKNLNHDYYMYDAFRIHEGGHGKDAFSAYVRSRASSWKDSIFISLGDDITPHLPEIRDLLRLHVLSCISTEDCL